MTTVAWQRAEGALVAVGTALWLWAVVPHWPLWFWPVALLAPDLAMVAYVLGSRRGAWVYNAAHLYAGGAILAGLGHALNASVIVAQLGLVWLAHVGVDRALGYGLKEVTSFRDTHLGRIGR